MSLYGDYVKEREGREIIEKEWGFATYKFVKDRGETESCYIIDIYVKPKNRTNGFAKNLLKEINDIAKQSDCKQLLGSVDLLANNPTDSLKTLLAVGFELHSIDRSTIYMRKKVDL